MKAACLGLFAVMLAACLSEIRTSPPHSETPVVSPVASQAPTLTPTFRPAHTQTNIPTITPSPASDDSITGWLAYDTDPDHLWNRLYRQFYRRTAQDGQAYGWDSLDPLLWEWTTYLLEGDSYQQAIQVLDEFNSQNGEQLIADPVKRAMLQRDLWAVFDWLALRGAHPAERQALRERVAEVLHRLALPDESILGLPNNYQAAIESRAFPEAYQAARTDFLPAGLFMADGDWICVGSNAGLIAPTHTDYPFYGRSAFLVFIRLPGGRDAALDFLAAMNAKETPDPTGLDIALVRQALLIDAAGQLMLSPLVESIQVRHFTAATTQVYYEFALNRPQLFDGSAGGLQPVHQAFAQFGSHADLFEVDYTVAAPTPLTRLCTSCHNEPGQGVTGLGSILSYSRLRFPLPNPGQPILGETTPDVEAQAVMAWKYKQDSWQALADRWP